MKKKVPRRSPRKGNKNDLTTNNSNKQSIISAAKMTGEYAIQFQLEKTEKGTAAYLKLQDQLCKQRLNNNLSRAASEFMEQHSKDTNQNLGKLHEEKEKILNCFFDMNLNGKEELLQEFLVKENDKYRTRRYKKSNADEDPNEREDNKMVKSFLSAMTLFSEEGKFEDDNSSAEEENKTEEENNEIKDNTEEKNN